jgi:4-amino-4-deoxy-L-arabinose transferase-like glycosyltransferase
LAFAACFANLGARGQSHDECVHFSFSRELYDGEGFVYDPWRHGPFLYYLNALSYYLFGVSDLTARLGPATFGVILVLLPALLRRQLGRIGALAASAMTLLSPSTLYYARYLRNDIYMMVWALCMAVALFEFMRTRKVGWLYLGAASTALSLATKETAYITGYIGLSFLAMLAARRWLSPRAARLVTIAASTLLLLLALAALGLSLYAQTLPEPDPEAETARGLGQAQIEQMLEVVLLLAGLLLLALLNWALLAGVEGELPGLRLLIGYVAAIASLLALCAIPAGLGWWAASILAQTGIAGWGVELAQFVALCVGAAAGGFFWWRFLGRHQDRENERTGETSREGGAEQLGAQLRAWLPGAFSLRAFWIAVSLAVGLFVLLYTTFFTHPQGLVTGLVGGLSYWLSQQEVKRASQPWFYYGILVALYEFLPLGLSALALVFVARTPRARRRRRTAFVTYLLYWTLAAWLIYSWAG